MKSKILITILIIAVIALAILIGVKIFGKQKIEDVSQNGETNIDINKDVVTAKKTKTWSGDSRSVAIVIDNVGEAKPQTGLNDAAIVYEITVEGGLTRLLAIFKDIKDKEETIGPVRSARPVFIDYVLENDSIFTHFGYSPRAEEDISKLKINNVNGLVADSAFWRTKEKSAPHNALTNIKRIYEYSEQKGYKLTSDERSVLKYVVDEVELENGQTASTVNIPYTSSHKVSYKYNAEKKLYERNVNGKVEKDWLSKENRTTKNIIITFAHNYTTNEEGGYGRQEIENIGNLKGYYITNGKIVEIICSKSSRSGKTIYKDKNGKEIDVNDGNTYIQIVPIDTKVTFE